MLEGCRKFQKMATIYVLHLKNNKWYVGKTTKPVETRFEEHVKGMGSSWTKVHKPIRIEKVIKNISNFDEDKITKEYMAKYGIENVRGGTYCQNELDETEEYLLQKEIWMAQGKCTTCGEKGHYAKDCNLTEEYDHSDEESEFDNSCYRCGRDGHWASSCYAKFDINGTFIRDE